MLENPGYSPPTILRAVQTCSLAEDSHSLRSQTQGGQWAPGLCQTELALLMSGVSFVGKLLGGLHMLSVYHQVPLGIVSGQASKHVSP